MLRRFDDLQFLALRLAGDAGEEERGHIAVGAAAAAAVAVEAMLLRKTRTHYAGTSAGRVAVGDGVNKQLGVI